MALTVSEMTKGELKKLIETIVEQKLLELFSDPDEGLTVRKAVVRRVQRQRQSVIAGDRGDALEEVARRLKLE